MSGSSGLVVSWFPTSSTRVVAFDAAEVCAEVYWDAEVHRTASGGSLSGGWIARVRRRTDGGVFPTQEEAQRACEVELGSTVAAAQALPRTDTENGNGRKEVYPPELLRELLGDCDAVLMGLRNGGARNAVIDVKTRITERLGKLWRR